MSLPQRKETFEDSFGTVLNSVSFAFTITDVRNGVNSFKRRKGYGSIAKIVDLQVLFPVAGMEAAPLLASLIIIQEGF